MKHNQRKSGQAAFQSLVLVVASALAGITGLVQLGNGFRGSIDEVVTARHPSERGSSSPLLHTEQSASIVSAIGRGNHIGRGAVKLGHGWTDVFKPVVDNTRRWHSEPGMTQPIEAVTIPNMIPIMELPDVAPSTTGVMTRYFLDQVGLEPPPGSDDALLHTYRYTEPGDQGTDTHKGGGRDHILDDNGQPSGYGLKGSGINPVYSAVNGSFLKHHFRRNGLLELAETVAEQAVGLRIAANGGPIVPHRRISLLPSFIQNMILRSAKEAGSDLDWTRHLAVQVERDLRVPRESMVRATRAQGARLIGFQTFHNIGHGAMAPANQAAGNFLDLGHNSFNPPVHSGLYRCAVCVGAEGTTSNAPDWFLSSLGLYYPKAGDTNSYAFSMSRMQTTEVVHEMLKLVDPDASRPKISVAEMHAMHAAWREQLRFADGVDYDAHLLAFGEDIVGDVLPGDFKPHNLSISHRFVMQVAAMQKLLPESQAARAKEILFGISDDVAQVETLLNMYTRVFANVDLKSERAASVFNQEIPTNLMIHRMERRFENIPEGDLEAVQRAAQEFLKDDTAPAQHSAQSFLNAMEKHFGGLIEA